jgi:hypothetical protein
MGFKPTSQCLALEIAEELKRHRRIGIAEGAAVLGESAQQEVDPWIIAALGPTALCAEFPLAGEQDDSERQANAHNNP